MKKNDIYKYMDFKTISYLVFAKSVLLILLGLIVLFGLIEDVRVIGLLIGICGFILGSFSFYVWSNEQQHGNINVGYVRL